MGRVPQEPSWVNEAGQENWCLLYLGVLTRLQAVFPRKQKGTQLSSGLSPLSFIFLSASTGVIKLKNNGDFFIANEGRRPIYIDGRPVLCGSKWRLSNNSVVEVSWGQSMPGCVTWCMTN